MRGKNFAKEWMGKVVEVSHQFKWFVLDDPSWPKVYKLREPLVGWVVGYTYRRRGRKVWDGEQGYIFRSEGPSELVFLVRPWPNEKTIDVLPQHVMLTDKKPRTFAQISQNSLDSIAQTMREEMKDWPRDERGRWVKKGNHAK